jgi:GTP pyrophosphokinase
MSDLSLGDFIAEHTRQILDSLGGSPLFQLALKQLTIKQFPDVSDKSHAPLSPEDKTKLNQLLSKLEELVHLESRLLPNSLPKAIQKNDDKAKPDSLDQTTTHRSLTPKQISTQRQLERRMLLSSINDIRIAVLWLSFRLAQLRAVSKGLLNPPEGWLQQTLSLHAGLANRLSLWQLKWELEDLSFRLQQPQAYHTIAKALEEKRTQREDFIAKANEKITAGLAKYHIEASVKGRPKHIYSIYKKMQGKQKTLNEVYDLCAIRIMVEQNAACYTALGVVHDLWAPISKEFDDYIACPKPNGYQSLHTVVIAEDQRPLEIQIRTQAMNLYAEYGVAAHWHYKESSVKQAYAGKAALSGTDASRRLSWAREILNWDEDTIVTTTDDSSGFIYIFTPAGEVIELESGATPIDFAYAVHTQLGHRCRGAKVNGHLVSLNTALKTGQIVEISATKQEGAGPSLDWLQSDAGFLKTGRAKLRVRSWFHAQQLDTLKQQGRHLLEKELQRLGKTSVALQHVATLCGFADLDLLSLALARDEYSLKHVQDHLLSEPPKDQKDTKQTKPSGTSSVLLVESLKLKPHTAKQSKSMWHNSDILVHGIEGIQTQMAQCCKPVPPDDLIGFVARGKGVSIHRSTCPNALLLQQQFSDRILSVSWAHEHALPAQPTGGANPTKHDKKYTALLRVLVQAEADLLKTLSDLLSKHQASLKSYQQKEVRGNPSRQMVELELWIAHREQMTQLANNIEQLSGVLRVQMV